MKYDLRESNILSKLLSLGVMSKTEDNYYRCNEWNLLLMGQNDFIWVWDSKKGSWEPVKNLKHIERMAIKLLIRGEP